MNSVSVIIPAYNAHKHIETSINSLLIQAYPNLEIIIVNDGSTDNTADIVRKYLPKVTLINQQHRGVASARNRALDIVTGDYILFLDADDFLDSDCIEKLMYHVNKTNADIIKFRLCYEYPDGSQTLEKAEFENELFITKRSFKENIYKKFLTGISFNSICRSLFKRKIITDLHFNEEMKTAEDAVFAVQAYTRAKSFLYLSDVFYHYTQSSLGLTGRGLSLSQKYKCNFLLIRELLSHLEDWEMNSFKYKSITLFRIFTITLSKIARIIKKK